MFHGPIGDTIVPVLGNESNQLQVLLWNIQNTFLQELFRVVLLVSAASQSSVFSVKNGKWICFLQPPFSSHTKTSFELARFWRGKGLLVVHLVIVC